jgi:hypothetical protein
MKTIKNSKDITTLEVGDVVVFGDLKYKVATYTFSDEYYLDNLIGANNAIFKHLNINKRAFIENLGINADYHCDFPEVCSLEAITAIVSALFKEYEKQNQLPKTWEEFCDKHPVTPDEYWIETVYSRYCNGLRDRKRDAHMDKNVCVSLQEAKAHTALMQLRQLRKAYVKGWEPDYKQQYYGIIFNANGLDILPYALVHKSMSFPTRELAKQFLTNFKDLLEIAKPLL